MSCKLGRPSIHPIRRWSTAHRDKPAEAQNSPSCNIANEITKQIHVAANWSLATIKFLLVRIRDIWAILALEEDSRIDGDSRLNDETILM